MKRESFSYHFTTSKSPKEVFERLLDVRQWWFGLHEETIEGKSHNSEDEFTFKAGGGMHYTKQKLIELIPNQKIGWLVTESELRFLDDPSEWKGTKLQFDLSPDGAGTKVTFTHDGLVPQIECYDNCSTAWTGYLKNLEKALN